MPYRVDYAECESCAMVQQSPMPNDTAHFYEAYPVHKPKGKTFALFRRLLIRNVYFAPTEQNKSATLLDLGCGDGSYLESVQGKFGRIFGFEPGASNGNAIAERLQCEVFTDTTSAQKSLAGQVDVVTAHFVLEHVPDPNGSFEFVSSLLKSGGIFHLALPEIKSREARLFGRKWHGLDAPRHVIFPELKSLRLLADRHGFDVERTGYGIFPVTIAASIVTVLTGRHRTLPFLLLLPFAFLVASLFPQGIATFQLRRR